MILGESLNLAGLLPIHKVRTRMRWPSGLSGGLQRTSCTRSLNAGHNDHKGVLGFDGLQQGDTEEDLGPGGKTESAFSLWSS
jgi:hypothetical protein